MRELSVNGMGRMWWWRYQTYEIRHRRLSFSLSANVVLTVPAIFMAQYCVYHGLHGVYQAMSKKAQNHEGITLLLSYYLNCIKSSLKVSN